MAIMCFDIGGTFIKYGVLDFEGNILCKGKTPTPLKNCRHTIPALLSELTNDFKKRFNIEAVGISTAGQVDSRKGEIIFATDNLPNYTGTKLSEQIREATGLKVYVENDVNAAALGELWRGSGKGHECFVCLTLGTGVGGAIIINGKLYKGRGGSAGELGHLIINENGEKCTCSNSGCFERYASTSSLIRSYSKFSGIKEDEITGEIIIQRVIGGDPRAVESYNKFLDHIATGLVSITHILDPGLIIIGGGISSAGEFFFKDLNDRFKRRVMPSFARYTEIVPASLQNDAGLIGACYITLAKS